jgi:hypothetical protein
LRLTLGGALGLHGDHEGVGAHPAGEAGEARILTPGRVAPPFPTPSTARVAIALLIVGFGLLNVAEASWAHAIGVVCLLGAVVVGFLAVVPAWLAPEGG